MAYLNFAGVDFYYSSAKYSVTYYDVGDLLRNYTVSSNGNTLNFQRLKVGNIQENYSGDINFSALKVGSTLVSFSGDLSGSVTIIGNQQIGMNVEKTNFLDGIFSSLLAPSNVQASTGQLGETIEVYGTSGNDKFSTYDINNANPSKENITIYGYGGDDSISLFTIYRNGFDAAYGGEGDDFFGASVSNSSYASIFVSGDLGVDQLYVTSGHELIGDFRLPYSSIIEFDIKDEGGSMMTIGVSTTTEMISFGVGSGKSVIYLTEDIANGRIRTVDFSEAFARAYGDNADWALKGLNTYDSYHNITSSAPDTKRSVVSSSWSGVISVNRELTANPSSGVLQAKQIDKDSWTGPTGSVITGGDSKDIIRGLAGWDILDAGAGNDLIHGGNGRDIITGGSGSDELHGDFGWNTYTNQRDGSVDLIAIKSDQFLSNHWYGKAGNSPNGEKSDIIEGLDSIDQIKVIGVATSDLSFSAGISHKGLTGIGIYAKGVLEALYTGGDLSVSQVSSMTTGDDSDQAMANQLWSYWSENIPPVLQA